VKIYLPRLAGNILADETAVTASGGEGSGETILVVEDDGDVRAYIVEVLRGLNYEVLEAQDASSALGVFERKEADSCESGERYERRRPPLPH
jgi:hypothetical protein